MIENLNVKTELSINKQILEMYKKLRNIIIAGFAIIISILLFHFYINTYVDVKNYKSIHHRYFNLTNTISGLNNVIVDTSNGDIVEKKPKYQTSKRNLLFEILLKVMN